MSKIIGIDLGTTNSVVAVLEGGEPAVIATAEGSRTMPSIVAFKANGERVVGASAKRQSVVNSQNTISSVKRFMGHKFEEVSADAKTVSYKVKKGKKDMAAIHVPALNKDMTPEEISAMILQKLKTDAEAFLGESVTKAVITVPAYFNDSQRQATKDAGEIAGLEVLRIINEPTAAALAYGLDKKSNETILVFDLGGGTFDVSLLDVGDGAFEVLATNGDSHLGGDDFDNLIVNWMINEFKQSSGVDLSKDAPAMQRLRESAEKAKIELSSQITTQISLPYVTAVDNQPLHLELSLTRAKFEEMSQGLLDRIKKPLNTVLNDTDKKYSEIDEIILVGGSTRLPMVYDLIKSLTNKEPNKGVNPDEAVALGAAVQAGIIGGDVKGIVLLDVTPLSLGVEVNGGMMDILIEKNSSIPTQRKNIYTTAVDNQPEVDVHVLQGERPVARENKTIGRFSLTGIPLAPARIPQIEVSFDIDANGILNVSAKDLGTGKEQTITISGSGNLSRDEIDNMIKDAEINAEADTKTKEYMELRNKADALVYSVDKMMKDDEENNLIGVEDKESIQKLTENLKEVLKSDDKDSVAKAYEETEAMVHKVTADLYQKLSQSREAGGENTQSVSAE